MHMQNLIKIHPLVLKIFSGNKILTLIKRHNSVINLQKWMYNNPILDLPNINAYAKFGQIPVICSQDIEQKRNSDIKGHNTLIKLQKLTRYNPNLDVVNINAKFGQIWSIFLKILSGNKILTSIKGHNSLIKLRKLKHNNPNLDLAHVKAYAKFCQIPLICSQDTER